MVYISEDKKRPERDVCPVDGVMSRVQEPSDEQKVVFLLFCLFLLQLRIWTFFGYKISLSTCPSGHMIGFQSTPSWYGVFYRQYTELLLVKSYSGSRDGLRISRKQAEQLPLSLTWRRCRQRAAGAFLLCGWQGRFVPDFRITRSPTDTQQAEVLESSVLLPWIQFLRKTVNAHLPFKWQNPLH